MEITFLMLARCFRFEIKSLNALQLVQPKVVCIESNLGSFIFLHIFLFCSFKFKSPGSVLDKVSPIRVHFSLNRLLLICNATISTILCVLCDKIKMFWQADEAKSVYTARRTSRT